MEEAKFEIIKRYVESKEEKALNECLERLIERSESIGLGGNAEVFGLNDPHFGELCVKKIHKIPQMRCNDEETEFEYQEEIGELGVRVPALIAYIQNEETKDKYIIMERIMGPSFEDIIERNVALPENYDHTSFWKELNRQLKLMHDANIYHRDLHKGNIMIDKDGGPAIIDFGTAGRSWGSEENPYKDAVPMLNSKTGRYDMASGYFQRDESKAEWIRGEIAKKLQN